MISEDRYEELSDWDAAYRGETIMLTRAELVERLRFDGDELENGNYHGDAAALRELAEIVEALPAETALGWFAWTVSDLSAIRRCRVVG